MITITPIRPGITTLGCNRQTCLQTLTLTPWLILRFTYTSAES